jgi:chromatin structure-remodeling complex subunit SFH1
MAPAQAFVTSYAPRLRQYANSFLTPVIQTQSLAPTARTTKRGTTVINYADDAYDDDDFDDSEGGARRPTGLRSLRREDLEKKDTAADKLGKEIHDPIDVQGIYREWMIRRTVKPTYENLEYAPCAHLVELVTYECSDLGRINKFTSKPSFR